MKTLAHAACILAVACILGVGIYAIVPRPAAMAPDGVSGAAPASNNASANAAVGNAERQSNTAALPRPDRGNGNGAGHGNGSVSGIVSLAVTLAVFLFVYVVVAFLSAFIRRRPKLGA